METPKITFNYEAAIAIVAAMSKEAANALYEADVTEDDEEATAYFLFGETIRARLEGAALVFSTTTGVSTLDIMSDAFTAYADVVNDPKKARFIYKLAEAYKT